MYRWNKESSTLVSDLHELENKYHDTEKEFNDWFDKIII